VLARSFELLQLWAATRSAVTMEFDSQWCESGCCRLQTKAPVAAAYGATLPLTM